MKKRFLLLLTALFVLAASTMSVQADTTIKQYLNTLTGDEFYGKDIPTSGSYFRVATTADAGTFTVVTEESGNYAYEFLGGATAKKAMTICTYTNLEGTSSKVDGSMLSATLQKMTAKVKFSSLTAQTQLFTLSKDWGVGPSSDTGGVVIRNGGAYYYDVDATNDVCFIEDGTLSVDVWYTIEVAYDFRNSGNYMSASVYDENGVVIATSEWAHVSDYARYNASKNQPHLRTHISFSNVPEDETVMVDDIALYILDDLSLVNCIGSEVDTENNKAIFTFDEKIDTDLLSKANVRVVPENPMLNVYGLYNAAISDDTITVDLSKLPYNEKFTVVVSGYALTEEAQCSVTTPEDPFDKAVTDVTFEAADGEAIAAGDSVIAKVSLENNSNSGRDYMLLVTSWNSKNECVAIRNVVGYIELGADPVITLPAVPFEDAGSIIRVSLLDNWYNMTPIGDAYTFELGGE